MRNWAFSVFGLSLLALTIGGSLSADDVPSKKSTTSKKSTKKAEPMAKDKIPVDRDSLVPLYRFFDKRRNECIYSVDPEEIGTFQNDKNYIDETIIGAVAPTEIPESSRLWRSLRLNGDRVFYLRAPAKARIGKVEEAEFRAFVWLKPGDGRIAVYAHTWPDGSDVYLEPDLEKARKKRDDMKKALAINRVGLLGKDFSQAAFYIYPHGDMNKAEDSKESKTEKPDETK